jgi:transposase-like protein
VMGLVQRKGKKGHSTVMASVGAGTTTHHLQPQVRANVAKGSALFTDAQRSYLGLREDYRHEIIDHAVEYVRGEVHTNGLENFWSCLKRTIKGTYVAVDPYHVFRYLDEQTFRFNNRKDDDHGRFRDVVRQIVGKRLTYATLIGGDLLPATT